MREVWVEIKDNLSPDKKKTMFAVSEKNGCTVIVKDEEVKKAKSFSVRIASREDGDIKILKEEEITLSRKPGKPVCVKLTIGNPSDEKKVTKAVENGIDYIIIWCTDWKIIPIENIIAESYGKTKLLAEVINSKEAKIAFETLELGVDGVVLKTSNPREIEATVEIAAKVKTRTNEREKNPKIELDLARIVSSKQLSLGSRVCIDTCDMMKEGEGMLVGCQSSGLFLIHAEVGKDLKSDPRPFRVNAGAVSLYILTPGNRTRYISELTTGDEVLIVDKQGNSRSTIVGRVKIEKRPMILVEAEVKGQKIKIILQNAETIRLIGKDGPNPVTNLEPNDQVLVQLQKGGRHFGVLVEDEMVIEK